MSSTAALALLALLALALPLLFWYVYVRIKLANNPNLIAAGVGSVKLGLFLHLTRRYRGEERPAGSDPQLLAAAVVNALFGEPSKDDRLTAFLEGNAESVARGLRGLASEPEAIRGLITAAFRFRSKLAGSQQPAAADQAEASQRANELGITTPQGQTIVLWSFVREAARFLRAEHKLSSCAGAAS